MYTVQPVTRAIASFERAIVSVRSPYDRYRWGGDIAAISDSAKRAEIRFSSSDRGGCFQCHGGWNFTAVRFEGSQERSVERDARDFFNTGVLQYLPPNRGLYEHTMLSEDIGKLRPPTLRNIAITAPYMHDGGLATLEEVIVHYAAGGQVRSPEQNAYPSALPFDGGREARPHRIPRVPDRRRAAARSSLERFMAWGVGQREAPRIGSSCIHFSAKTR